MRRRVRTMSDTDNSRLIDIHDSKSCRLIRIRLDALDGSSISKRVELAPKQTNWREECEVGVKGKGYRLFIRKLYQLDTDIPIVFKEVR